jgi:hypothetical protein
MRLRDVDWILALLFLGMGCAIGYRFLFDVGVTNFYQLWMPATVMWACGQGLVDPATIPPTLSAFLSMEISRFDCGDLASVARTSDASPFFYAHVYLGLAAAVFWRLQEVSYISLAPVLGILYGAYAMGCFVLLRLFVNRLFASCAAVVVSVSPVAISTLSNLRDFSKAPFVIWAIVLLVLAVREQRFRRLLIIAGMMGFVVGVGSGFRFDVKLMLLLGIAVLAFGLSRAVDVRTRIATLFTFIAVSGVLGLPGTIKGGAGSAGYFILQGATEPFRALLGLTKAHYDLGYLYLDAMNLATIVADLRPRDPVAWDAHESMVFDVHDSYALTRANAYVVSWLPFFAGDLITRSLKSAAWISGYYALFSPDRAPFSPTRAALDPYHPISYAYTPLVNEVEPYFEYLVQPWLPYVGLLGCLALAFRRFAHSPREAACIFFVFATLLMTPGIQFSVRHFFHYEVVFWLAVVSLLSLPFGLYHMRRSVVPFARWCVAILLIGAAGYASALWIQDRLLTREILHLLNGQRQPVATITVDVPNGNSLFEVAASPANAAMVHSRLSYLLRTAADRLLVRVGGENCPAGELQLTLTYEKLSRFNRILTIDVPTDGQKFQLIVPAFYTPLEHFRGIAVPTDRTQCIADVSTLLEASKLPSIFTAVLPPGWESEPMFQFPGGF